MIKLTNGADYYTFEPIGATVTVVECLNGKEQSAETTREQAREVYALALKNGFQREAGPERKPRKMSIDDMHARAVSQRYEPEPQPATPEPKRKIIYGFMPRTVPSLTGGI